MSKVVEECKKLCENKIIELQKKYDKAYANYADTGLRRYYNSMCRYEDEIEEIEKFVYAEENSKPETDRYRRQYNELNDSLYFVKKMMNNLTDEDFTSPRVTEILNHIARMV